jgi:anaerobic dimethyl sulfoxide reductase subunit B (iron-sulfur subunit)
MERPGFYFDADMCIGCRTCQVACQDRHRFEPGVLLREVKTYEIGRYPEARVYHLSLSCMHCENPACVVVCPVEAMYRAEDGTVQHDDEKCIGCRKCVKSCPYGAVRYRQSAKKAAKCDACLALRREGRAPVCVDACPMRALEFGSMEELRKRHEGERLVCELPVLPGQDVTKPNILIGAKACMMDDNVREIQI